MKQNNLKQFVENLSKEFIEEAISSPRMFEDMASMEKYLSESYDGRVFVELLQNADDAESNNVKITTVENNLIVANNGRIFNEEDIKSICRSGSSLKKKGTSIGYRGVGFKSVTSISKIIVIYSGNTCFTFSKSYSLKTLHNYVKDVPTVRIPFVYSYDNLSPLIQKKINQLKGEGYTTFFIFLDSNLEKFYDELCEIDETWILFLKHVNGIEVDIKDLEMILSVQRNIISENISIISSKTRKKRWYVKTQDSVSIAFLYDDIKGVVPLQSNEAMCYCFLPTLDSTGFPFILNANFSTDPSRKHIIIDSDTEESLLLLANLYFETIRDAIENQDIKMFNIIDLFCEHLSFSEITNIFESNLKELLTERKWLSINGKLFSPREIYIYPSWLNRNNKKEILRFTNHYDKAPIYSLCHYTEKGDSLLMNLGGRYLPTEFLSKFLTKNEYLKSCSIETISKLFVYCYRGRFNDKETMDNVYIPSSKGLMTLREITNGIKPDQEFIKSIKSLLSFQEFNTLISNYEVLKPKAKAKKKSILSSLVDSDNLFIGSSNIPEIQPWKTPVQNCFAIEALKGNKCTLCKEEYKGYNVQSETENGDVIYIAIKSIDFIGKDFTLTNNEYLCAQIHQDKFEVLLIVNQKDKVVYKELINPLKELSFEKVVKEWEWKCYNYISNNNDTNATHPNVANNILKNFDDMDGVEFEQFIEQLLLKNGYDEVNRTQASHDQGIDLIAYKDGIKFGIQCKCYSSDIGNSAVQEAFAGKKYYKCNVAIVITNRYFTKSASELALANEVILWDRDRLLNLIRKA